MFYATLTEDDTCLLCVGSGTVEASEIFEAKAALDLNRLKAVLFAIVDFQETQELNLTVNEIRDLARMDQTLSRSAPNACVAIVAPKDSHFGLARMWEIFVETSGWKTGVFRTFQEACCWARYNCPNNPLVISATNLN